jgi:hypothetical protein
MSGLSLLPARFVGVALEGVWRSRISRADAWPEAIAALKIRVDTLAIALETIEIVDLAHPRFETYKFQILALGGCPRGIPNRVAICATLNPGATAAQINSAIASWLSGQVVKLNADTYNLSTRIIFNNKNVTLRRAGPDRTFLVFICEVRR